MALRSAAAPPTSAARPGALRRIPRARGPQAMSEPLIVIGNGMAAARFVDELAQRALGRYAIAVIGEEPRLAYNRVLLSVAARRRGRLRRHRAQAGALVARPRRDPALRRARDRRSTPAARNVTLAGGTQLAVLQARLRHRLAADQAGHARHRSAGVLTFRDVDDVNAIAATQGRRRRAWW